MLRLSLVGYGRPSQDTGGSDPKLNNKRIMLTLTDLSPKTVPIEVREYISSKESRVLELGCGRGIAVIQLHREGYSAKGYEVEGGYPKSSKNLCQEVGIDWDSLFDIGGADSRLPYENNSFDLVWTDQVLEHVEDLNFFLSEVKRVLRPGGIFWARFPSKFNLIEPHSGILMFSYSLAMFLGPMYLKYSLNKLDAISSSKSSP
jgi:SAM-dependent methyltransferase